VVGLLVNNELGRIWKQSQTHLRYYSAICLAGMRKIKETFSKASWQQTDLNPGTPEYEAAIPNI
jgi:hypothetical protein